ncbi:low-affinity peptide transporter [Aphelenchoides avenae]|nr:low-affinity peptide transporter [Aphelenchus avenae]
MFDAQRKQQRSILADGYIGKFWTILWVSLFYAAGQLILTYASTLPEGHSLHPGLDLLGLVVISVGTGGVKACVAAFGADQFPQSYVTMISVYFAVFYWTIQAGSTLSTVLTPIFRTFSCMGQDTCYPLAFGVPAGLMLIATAFFVSGSFWYKKIPPKENVIAKVFRTVWRAIRNRFKYGNVRRKPHWMDHALDDHDCGADKKCLTHGRCAKVSFVEDIKQLFRIVIMMLPVPVFWSLYDQQGSKWLLQAIAMDGKVTDGWTILPDQMSAANAILTMVFIPIFQFIIYPLVEAVGFRITPLRKMVAGGVLASLCFVAAGSLQMVVNHTLPDPPLGNDAFLSVINGFSTDCSIVVDGIPGLDASRIIPHNSSLVDDRVAGIADLLRIQADKTPTISPVISFKG